MITRYREAVEKLGISDYEVAKLSGVPDATLYDWIKRAADKPASTLSVENARKLAKFLGITLDELLAEEGGE